MFQMMKIMLLLFILNASLATMIQSENQSFENHLLGDSILQPGKGYSSDTQQISAATCYDMIISKKSNAQSIIKLNEGSTYDTIVNTFGIDVTAKMNFAMFSGGASYNYLRSIQTTTSSFSISYYHLIERDVSLNFVSSGVLNPVGKMIYQDGQNEVFRLACGDQIVTSYKQRATLFFTFNLNFKNKIDKETIQSKIGASLGGIGSISAEIQKFASQSKIQGSIDLQVYQVGGDPTKIGQIISSKDPSGVYYLVKCSLTDLTACNKTVSDLIGYSSQSFPTQINFDTEQGLSGFGVNNIKYISASYFGMKTGTSFVTQDVINARLQLSNIMQMNQYYEQNLNTLLNSYPVEWDKSSQIYNNLLAQHTISSNNIKTLLNVNNPEQGSLGCYSSPQRCTQIYSRIQQLLKQIDTSLISTYMKTTNLKYMYQINGGSTNWIYLSGDNQYNIMQNPNNFRNIYLSVNDQTLNSTYNYHDSLAGQCYIKWSNLIFNNNNNRYQGVSESYCEHYTGRNPNFWVRKNSQYYFEGFQNDIMIQNASQEMEKMIISDLFDGNIFKEQ